MRARREARMVPACPPCTNTRSAQRSSSLRHPSWVSSTHRIRSCAADLLLRQQEPSRLRWWFGGGAATSETGFAARPVMEVALDVAASCRRRSLLRRG